MKRAAFTLIEMLTVMAVIVVLAGMVISIAGYATNKGARTRAEAEIQAFTSAIESYKADNGVYPRTEKTDDLDPRTNGNPTGNKYVEASQDLYELLSGDANRNFRKEPLEEKMYFDFGTRPHMLRLDKNSEPGTGDYVKYIQDPFGYAYGYSTAWQKDYDKKRQDKPDEEPQPDEGYNPTFDLWSTGGAKAASGSGGTVSQQKWIKNW